MGGFSFCGKHSSRFGIEYIPDAADRMLSLPDFEQQEESVTSRDGGYYYGNRVKYRDFTLKCYFEHVNEERYEAMGRWLSRDNYGRLVFDDRPLVYYEARINKIPTGKIYPTCGHDKSQKYYSGTQSIYFRAYEPFGKMTKKALDKDDGIEATRYTGILWSWQMPPEVSPTLGTHLIYNPGTEYADTIIRIGGSAPNGVKITNYTTGRTCSFVALPSGGDYIEANSYNGKIRRLPAQDDNLSYEFHNDGYLRLAPCTPYERRIAVTTIADSNVVEIFGMELGAEQKGQYICITHDDDTSEWRKILSVQDPYHAVVDINMPTTETFEDCLIATVNEIHVEGEGVELTKLEIEYIPQVR